MLSFKRAALLGVFLGATGLLMGCGAASPRCNGGGFVLQVSPAVATVDHMAAIPGNQVQFTGVAAATAPPGCPVPQHVLLEYATWANPDTVNIQISSANDQSNGTAVCKGQTKGAVVLTGAFAPISVPPTAQTTAKMVLLTCK